MHATQGVNTGSWTCEQVGSATTDTSVPVGVALPTGVPFNTGASGDESVATAISNAGVNTSSDTNVYQLRLVTSGSGQAGNVKLHYNSVDIKVTGTGSSDTWSVVYPPQTDATTTVVTSSPTSPVNSATPVSTTFTATVTPTTPVTTSGGVGSVEFFNGGTQIGTTQLITGAAVSGNYTAAVTLSEPANSTRRSRQSSFHTTATPRAVDFDRDPLCTLASRPEYDVDSVDGEPGRLRG